MKKFIRFGTFVREISIRQQQVSYNELTPKIARNEQGEELPYHAPKLNIRSIDVYRIQIFGRSSVRLCTDYLLYIVVFWYHFA